MKASNELKYRRAGTCRILALLALVVLSALPAAGQIDTTEQEQTDHDSDRRYISLFDTDDILEVFLYLDLSTFLLKKDRAASFDGRMVIPLSETDSLDKKVTVNYRGKSRYERCRYPPMRVTFKKPLYESSDSGKIKKIKLVNQCQANPQHEEYIIREYLVYKLYSVLTDTSFRVRLLKVNFIDTKKERKPIVHYGIFVEPEELLEKRTNSLEIKTKALTQEHMFPAMIDRLAVFNYMVSNWDWSVPGQHNVMVLKSSRLDKAGLGIPVPFDFDLTGVVNADYAIPPPGIGIETNRDRMFTGICRTSEVYREVLLMFLDRKDEFYSVINNYPYLSKADKKDITLFLDQFFVQLEKPRGLDNLIDIFLDNCKKL
ncbi:MAG: hypothetical protein MUC78_03320 [Bacteroidales bacterium]|nr:hypothetical protein [Bacteroidales bacterium]